MPSPRSRARLGLIGEQLGWCWYDWANSAFPTTVGSIFMGPYLTAIARSAADGAGFVHPFGLPVHAGALFPYAVSLSALLQVLALPVLGAFADRWRRTKALLGAFAYLGALATVALYAVEGERYLLGAGLFVAATLAFSCSIVVYNAFLPEIAEPARRDHVSSVGWAIGYLGGGLLLALNLALVSQAEALGLSVGAAVRISLASAGLCQSKTSWLPSSNVTSTASCSGVNVFRSPGRVIVCAPSTPGRRPSLIAWLIRSIARLAMPVQVNGRVRSELGSPPYSQLRMPPAFLP